MCRIVTIAFVVTLLLSGAASAATPAQKCAAAKLKATGKQAYDEIKCYQKAVIKSLPVSNECVVKSAQKLYDAFTKVEVKGGCATTVDAEALSSKASLFVEEIRDEVVVPGVTPTTTSTTLPAGPVCCNVAVTFISSGGPTFHLTDGCFTSVSSSFCNAIDPAANPSPCYAVGLDGGCLKGQVGAGVCDGGTGFCAPAVTGTGMCCQRSNQSGSTTCLEGPDTGANRAICDAALGVVFPGARCLPLAGVPDSTTCQ